MRDIRILSDEEGQTKVEILQGDFSKAEDGQKRFEDDLLALIKMDCL